MKKNKGKIAGILGAVIIHLIAGIIFMVVQIGTLNINEYSREYQIALEDLSEPERKVTLQDQQGTSAEKIFQGEQEVLNIARNLANQPDVKINAEDYIDKVKEELIKSGKLGKDNYIDEQKKMNESRGDEKLAIGNDTVLKKVNEKPRQSTEMAANFKGPTRIYYDLVGRTHLYLPIPIYKCQGSGLVVLGIEVDQYGNVQKAQVIDRESTASDPCLVETAVATALQSKFNPDVNSPRIQLGTLSYQFVAQ